MKPKAEGGGKAAIVLSASPLFNGDPGSGPSNIRRWIFEQDLIDCIVKIPSGVFFRTGINTYLWLLSNNKPENRKGLVQLIDASDMKETLRKNLGKKNAQISPEQIAEITRMYVDGEVNEHSVIVPYSDFIYRQVTTQQPLRMGFVLTEDTEQLKKHAPALPHRESRGVLHLIVLPGPMRRESAALRRAHSAGAPRRKGVPRVIPERE